MFSVVFVTPEGNPVPVTWSPISSSFQTLAALAAFCAGSAASDLCSQWSQMQVLLLTAGDPGPYRREGVSFHSWFVDCFRLQWMLDFEFSASVR